MVGTETAVVLLLAGLIFLWALGLGVWKYAQMARPPAHRAHFYVDTAHRAALLYSFATLLIAAFVELSDWPAAVNLAAALVVIAFFVIAIATYQLHGMRQDTENQFVDAPRHVTWGMYALIIGEIGGFAVLLAGFVKGELL